MIRLFVPAVFVTAMCLSRSAAAADPPADDPTCVGTLGPSEIVSCALARSPEVREARAVLRAIAGRRVAAGLWLPGNPILAINVGRGTVSPGVTATASGPDLDWNAALSQEMEIAGQRSARVEAVDAEAAAQIRRVAVAEEEVAAGALRAYFELLAAREAVVVAEDVAKVADDLGRLAEGRAREAMTSGLDADVARSESSRLAAGRYEAERRLQVAAAALGAALGIEASQVKISGSLLTPASPSQELDIATLAERALRLRGDVAASEMEQRVREHRITTLQRERIPNVTLSVFAQQGALEQTVGAGLSIPIPLPAPIGHTRAGELAEARGQLEQAKASSESVRRRVSVEVAQAVAERDARREVLKLFPHDLLERARGDLREIGVGLSSRQLSIREALLAQRSLIELLQADIGARAGSALAWVEVNRAVGLPFPGMRSEP
jgi:outer membrane protein, heavy metal efflux system